MAGRISVECPGCLAKLNLADSSKLGKKIKCPKCSDVFVAKAADDDEADDADDDEAPAKSAGRKRPAAAARKGSGKKGASSGGGNNGALIAGGVVGAVALLGIGLFLAGIFSSPPPQPAPAPAMVQPAQAPVATEVAHAAPPPINPAERILALRWMPADTELVMHVKVADLWKAPLLKSQVESPEAMEGVKKMQAMIGLAPDEIESVTFGMVDMQSAQGMQPMVMGAAMGMPVQPKLPKAMLVIRSRKSVTLEEILKLSAELKPAEHNMKKYFEWSGNGDSAAGWLADPTTLIVSSPDDLKVAMDRGETVKPRKELTFMDPAPQIILLVAPKDPKTFASGMSAPVPVPGAPASLANTQKALSDSLTAFGLGVSIKGGFDVQTALLSKDPDAAGKLKTGFDELIAEGRKQFEGSRPTLPPVVADLGAVLLGSLKAESQGTVTKVSVGVPDSAQSKLEELQGMLPLLLMAGGMGGAGPMNLAGDMKPGPGTDPKFGNPGLPSGAAPPVAIPVDDAVVSPGMTEPVTPVTADGIPEGTTLVARTSWTRELAIGSEGKTSYPMKLMLELSGDGVAPVCGFGQLTLKTNLLSSGGAFRVAKTNSVGIANITKTFDFFDATAPARHNRPEGVLRISLPFETPKEASTSFENLEGSFKYFTATDAEEFTIEDAAKTAKRPLTNPALKAAGVKLLLARHEGLGNSLSLSCGKGFFLGNVHAIYPGQLEPVFFGPDLDRNQSVLRIFNAKFPEQLTLNFKLFRDVKEHTVNFKFAGIPLPDRALRPKDPGLE